MSWVTGPCVCVAPRCPRVMGLEERAETLCCVRDETASAPCPNLYPEAPARHRTVFGSGDFGMQAGLDEVTRAWGSVPGLPPLRGAEHIRVPSLQTRRPTLAGYRPWTPGLQNHEDRSCLSPWSVVLCDRPVRMVVGEGMEKGLLGVRER